MGKRAGRVVVVGAGITGLGAAWRLRRRGFDVTVLERERQAGGRVTTEVSQGFSFDLADSVLSSADRHLLGWIDELGLRDELLPLRPLLSAQLCRNRVSGVEARTLSEVARIPGVRPHHALRLLRFPRLWRRYAAAIDPEAPERGAELDDRSLADFGRLYFGSSVLERWMGPLVTATSLGDARETSRVLFLQRYRRCADERLGLPRAGLGVLPAAAAERLGARFGVRVTRIESAPGEPARLTLRAQASGSESREHVREADAVIVATSAPQALRIAAPVLEPAERDVLERTLYVPALVLGAALRRPFHAHPRRILVPHGEGSPLETALLEPGLRGGRAPAGAGLATLRATGAWSEQSYDLPAGRAEAELLDAFERLYPGARRAVSEARLFRVARAVPRFGVGCYREMARLEKVEADACARGRRVWLAGDYRMGPSLEGALASGYRAAAAVTAALA